MNNQFDTSDIKIFASVEVDKSSVASVEQEMARVLGSGSAAPAGQKSAMDTFAESMAQLAGIMQDMMRVMGDSTKAVGDQVALREKELGILKEQAKLGGGGGSKGGTFYGPGGAYGGRFDDERPDAGQPDGGPSRKTANMMLAAAAWAAAQSGNINQMIKGGFHDTDVARTAVGAVTSLPVIGGALGAFNLIPQGMEERDRYQTEGLNVFRQGGERSRFNFRFGWDRERHNNHFQRYGVSRQESLNLFGMAAGYGDDNIRGLTELQGGFGLGGQGASLMSSLRQGGDKTDSYQAFAEVLAVAIGSNLDRGRWGEAFSAMTRAAASVQSRGDVDRQALLEREMYINQLGGRFLGDTTAHQGLQSTYSSMQGGGGGALGNFFALRAAGLGDGSTSYWTAKARVARGDAAGGVGLEAILRQYMNLAVVRQYLATGSQEDLDAASGQLDMLTQGAWGQPNIEAVLRNMRQGMPQGPNAAVGDRALADPALPSWEMGPTRSKVRGDTPFTNNTNSINGNAPEMRGGGRSGVQSSRATFNSSSSGMATDRNGIPQWFLDEWMNMESGGNIGRTTKYNERGLFQIMGAHSGKPFASSEAARLGMTEEEHARLSTDRDLNMTMGSKLAAHYRRNAQGAASRHNLSWDEASMWRLTKMGHGGVGALEKALSKTENALGRAPGDWDEFYRTARPMMDKQGQNILDNANKMKIEVHVFDHKSTATVHSASSRQSGFPGQNNGARR